MISRNGTLDIGKKLFVSGHHFIKIALKEIIYDILLYTSFCCRFTNLKLILIICFSALKPHSPFSPPSRSKTFWKDARAAVGSSSFKALLL